MDVIISLVEMSSYFVISQNRICDIKISGLFCDINNQGYRIEFVISQNRFFDITKSRRFCDITNSIL